MAQFLNAGRRRICFCSLIVLWLVNNASTIAYGGGGIVRPVSLRHGLESQISLDWPLKDTSAVFRSNYFLDKQELAEKAGLDLKTVIEKNGVARFNKANGNFFMFFSNLAEAPSCKRDYLIQRIELTKSFYNKTGKEYRRTREYLVEVFKQTGRSMMRADSHFRSYSLNKDYGRSFRVEVEIGCGVLENQIEGKRWPYSQNILYKLLQDYSDSPGLYRQVKYNFSEKYSFGSYFTRKGLVEVTWPDFVQSR